MIQHDNVMDYRMKGGYDSSNSIMMKKGSLMALSMWTMGLVSEYRNINTTLGTELCVELVKMTCQHFVVIV